MDVPGFPVFTGSSNLRIPSPNVIINKKLDFIALYPNWISAVIE
jgi:hypothetical protein